MKASAVLLSKINLISGTKIYDSFIYLFTGMQQDIPIFNLKVNSWGVATPQRPKNCDNSKTTVDKNLKFFDFYYMTVL